MNGQEVHRGRLFLGCIIALVATAFGFIIRALVLDDWQKQFNLSEEQKGILIGAGLYPFAISIILFSLIVDKIGYGTSMVFAFFGHLVSGAITIYAGTVTDPRTAFQLLYAGAFLYALANGVVEAVINPVTATMYDRQKTHYLNILHAGWPGGLVLGGLLTIAFGFISVETVADSPLKHLWQWKVALVLLPTVAYGVLLLGQRFPVQERVAAGVSYRDMLREFGAGSCFIVTFLLVCGIFQILSVAQLEALKTMEPQVPLYVAAGVAAAAFVAFFLAYGSFGRPMFVFLLLIMLLLATTELGTDGWISDIMKGVLAQEGSTFNYGALVLIYTSAIMFVLRFFAGPIVERISPLGLLASSAAIACLGLVLIANAGSALLLVFLAATLYGLGKTFFWPTTLGVVSEQFPRGGALMLNAIAGVGMIGVGVLGGPLMGTIQDQRIDSALQAKAPELREAVNQQKPSLLGPANVVNEKKLYEDVSDEEYAKMSTEEKAKLADRRKQQLSEEQTERVNEVRSNARQKFLQAVAILPGIMFVCYVLLIAYFRIKGGYRPQSLDAPMAPHEA